jgi:transcriptional regulator with XRE-family HTH domain
MTSRTVLGERVRELREKRGLSKVDFGERTGLFHSYISRIESGHIVPDLDILERITIALGVPMYTLFLTDPQFLLKLTQEIGPAEGPIKPH